MSGMMGGPEGERLFRWMQESPSIFDGLRCLLHEYDQCKVAAEAAESERSRLQENCEALREEVRQLQTEVTRLQKERAESAMWFAAMMQEAAARFPVAPPPA